MTSNFTEPSSSSSYAAALWKDVDTLMGLITPSQYSNAQRDSIAAFVRRVLRRSSNYHEGRLHSCYDGDSCGSDEFDAIEASVFSVADSVIEDILLLVSGSCCSKTYLPDGDLDLVIVTPNLLKSDQDIQDLTIAFTALCQEISRKEQGSKVQNQSLYQHPHPQSSILASSDNLIPSVNPDYMIRNIEFINARTKLLHCIVDSYSIDITANQIGIIASMLFLEEVDREVGENHLFKRSIMLIKTWCLHESRLYCGAPILGGKEGMLSSYAISVMVMHLFNLHRDMHHPLQVLRLFLNHFQRFPWENNVLTLEGPHPIQVGTSSSQISTSNATGIRDNHTDASIKYHRCSNRFYPLLERLGKTVQDIAPTINENLLAKKKSAQPPVRFTLRVCNIQDPVDDTNNLGYSVTRNNLTLIDRALQIGASRLENLLTPSPALNNPLSSHQQHQPSQPPPSSSSTHVPNTPTHRMSPSFHTTMSQYTQQQHQHSSHSSTYPTPHYPFPIMPGIASATSAASYGGHSGNGSGSPRAQPPLPPPPPIPPSTTPNFAQTLPSQQYMHPIDSFFALSLQHYAHAQITHSGTEAVRRHSFTSGQSNTLPATSATQPLSSIPLTADTAESSSLADDPLAMNREVLLAWLKRAEEKARTAAHHRPPLNSAKLKSSLTSAALHHEQVLSSETDSITTSSILPVDIKSVSSLKLPNNDANCQKQPHQTPLKPIPTRPVNSNTARAATNRAIDELQLETEDSDSDNSHDDKFKRQGQQQYTDARSPSPSSTCSSLSSAITTVAESLDQSPPANVPPRPDSLSPGQEELLYVVRAPLASLTSSSSLLINSKEPKKTGMTDIAPTSSSSSPNSSAGTTGGDATSQESGGSLPFSTFSFTAKTLTKSQNEIVSSQVASSTPTIQKPPTHKKQNKHQKKPNTASIHSSAGVVASTGTTTSAASTTTTQKQGISLSISSNRGRSDSVRSQTSVTSTVSREERGVNSAAAGSTQVDSSAEESTSLWHVFTKIVTSFTSRTTRKETSIHPGDVARAVERRNQLQQHRRGWTSTGFRTWAALGVAVAVLAAIVSLHRSNVAMLRNENRSSSTSMSAKQQQQQQQQQHPASSSSVSTATTTTSNNAILQIMSKEPQSVLSRMFNLTQETTVSETKDRSDEEITSNTTEVNTTSMSTVATYWVQIGESLIFGSDEHMQSSSIAKSESTTNAQEQQFQLRRGDINSDLSPSSEFPSSASANTTTTPIGTEQHQRPSRSLYLWTKNAVPIAMSTQPLLSIAQTVLTDSGHYQCWQIKPLVLLFGNSSNLDSNIQLYWRAMAIVSVLASSSSTELASDKAKSNHLRTTVRPVKGGEKEQDEAVDELDWPSLLHRIPATGHVISLNELFATAVNSGNENFISLNRQQLQTWLTEPMSMERSHYHLITETKVSISKKPRVRNRPFYQEVKLGKPFFLPLEVEAIPAASFQWFKNGYPLPEQRGDVLVLDAIDFSSAGTYSCEVHNVAGRVLWLEATIHVTE